MASSIYSIYTNPLDGLPSTPSNSNITKEGNYPTLNIAQTLPVPGLVSSPDSSEVALDSVLGIDEEVEGSSMTHHGSKEQRREEEEEEEET